MLNSELERFIQEDLGPYDLSHVPLFRRGMCEAALLAKGRLYSAGIDVCNVYFQILWNAGYTITLVMVIRYGPETKQLFSLRGNSVRC
jgi:nicotinate-nucleotide pyrophosphorylase